MKNKDCLVEDKQNEIERKKYLNLNYLVDKKRKKILLKKTFYFRGEIMHLEKC